MYEWTEPYEDEYIKERIEELRQAQKDATAEWQSACLLIRTVLAACSE